MLDVAIVGAGPAGLALAASLKQSGLSVGLVEARDEAAIAAPRDDGREIALTHHSVSLLKSLGAWALIPEDATAPLREARVQNGPSPYALRFDPAFADAPKGMPLGLFVPNWRIRDALREVAWRDAPPALLAGRRVETVARQPDRVVLGIAGGERIEARLAVAADSRLSPTRRAAGIGAQVTRYGLRMIVCRMRHERDHGGVSTAWFDYGRQLSILPLRGRRCSVVLALPEAEARAVLALDDAAFSARVTALFGGRLGAMRQDDKRFDTELVTAYADRFADRRVALIGDAAVGMHPVTAQGFNLGLTGAVSLGRLLREAASAGSDVGGAAVLARHEAAHRRATFLPYQASQAIVRLYGSDALPARLMRNAGLRVANTLPLLRSTVLSRLMAA